MDAWAKSCAAAEQTDGRPGEAIVAVGGKEVATFVSPAAERLAARSCAQRPGLSRPWLLWLTECCLQGKDSTQRPQSTPPRLWWKECAARRGNTTRPCPSLPRAPPRRLLRGKLQRAQQQHARLGQRRKARLARRERTSQQGGTGSRATARAMTKGTWMSTGMRTISSPIFCSTSSAARTILTELAIS